MESGIKDALALLAFVPGLSCAQAIDGAIAYGGRAVPPMTAPELPGDWDRPPAEPPARQWDRALPLFAQRAVDRGIDLPNPYNVGLSLYLGREERVLSSLQVGFNGGPMQDASFVQFPSTRIHNDSPQLQVGGWILPFVNAYGIVGYAQGGGDIDIAIPGRDLMQFLGVPGCNLPSPPPLCQQTLTGTARADYHGITYGAGATFAGTFHHLFVALPITYVISDVTISDTKGKTWNVAPRAGWTQQLADGGKLTWYAGGTYLKSDFNITGRFTFPTAGTALGQDTTLRYSIHVEPRDRWNYLAGVNWTIDRTWGALAELGFGNSRSDVILTGFFRF